MKTTNVEPATCSSALAPCCRTKPRVSDQSLHRWQSRGPTVDLSHAASFALASTFGDDVPSPFLVMSHLKTAESSDDGVVTAWFRLQGIRVSLIHEDWLVFAGSDAE